MSPYVVKQTCAQRSSGFREVDGSGLGTQRRQRVVIIANYWLVLDDIAKRSIYSYIGIKQNKTFDCVSEY